MSERQVDELREMNKELIDGIKEMYGRYRKQMTKIIRYTSKDEKIQPSVLFSTFLTCVMKFGGLKIDDTFILLGILEKTKGELLHDALNIAEPISKHDVLKELDNLRKR